MSDNSKIEWTEASWNPIRARIGGLATERIGWHCEIVTPGCENCYAQTMNKRLGTHLPYLRRERENVSVYLDEKALSAPLRWRKPRRIFVCSMTDLFGEWVTDEMIDRVFAVMALCPQHTFQVLTKRAERMRDYANSARDRVWATVAETPDEWRVSRIDGNPSLPALGAHGAKWGGDRPWPLINVWLGVSVEDQRRADERIPLLLDTPAAVRWISAEPLLEPVDLMRLHYDGVTNIDAINGLHGVGFPHAKCARLDWVVAGGESGPGARPFDIGWARSIIAHCKAAGVACFVKQVGDHAVVSAPGKITAHYPIRHSKGGDPAEWPEDLRVRQYPAHDGAASFAV